MFEQGVILNDVNLDGLSISMRVVGTYVSDGGALRGIAVGFDAVGNRAVFTDIRPPVLIGRRYCCYDFEPAVSAGTSDMYRIRDQTIDIPAAAWNGLKSNPGVML